MAYRFLKGSTALTVVLSLALPPLPLMAQTGAGDAADPAQEAAPDEEALRRAAEAAAAAASAEAEAAQAAAEADAAATGAAADSAGPSEDELLRAAEEQAARAAAAAEEAARAAAEAEAAAAQAESQAVTPPQEPAEPQPEAQPEPEPAPEAEPEVTETPEPDPAPEAEAAEPAVPDAEPRPEDETVADPAPEAERLPQEEAETDPVPEAEPLPQEEAETDPVPEAEPLPQEEAENDPAPEAEPLPQEEAETDPAPEVERLPQEEAETDPAPGETAAPAQVAPEQTLPEAAIIDLFEPDAETAPPAAAGDAPDPDAPPVVTTTVVTEEDARSSDEEFEAIPNAAITGGVPISRSGLSRLEAAALAGVAGLAVGALLAGGSRVASNSGDRVVLEDADGSFRVLKDDDALLRRPGSTLRTESFADGSTRTFVLRDDGSEVITVRDATGRVLRRSVIDPFGNETQLFDDTRTYDPVDVTTLPRREARMDLLGSGDRESLRLALALAEAQDYGRAFSLQQVRDIVDVRELAPEITLDAITFTTASSVVRPDMAARLREVGLLMRDMIAENPREMFLVEGHTDAVGGWAYNLALSDRRAESVALALTEYFDVPPENLVVQGYGKAHLKVDTQAAEEANRRVAVRRITPLLGWAVATAQ